MLIAYSRTDSGHGGQAKDLDGDEDDGYGELVTPSVVCDNSLISLFTDETIYPVDFKTAGQMIDDEMHHLLVRPLPQGCRLTAIFDSVRYLIFSHCFSRCLCSLIPATTSSCGPFARLQQHY